MDATKQKFITFVKRFGSITPHDEEVIADNITVEICKHGEHFLRENKVCDRLGFIAEGVMRYCTDKDDGETVTCYFINENEFAADIDSFFSKQPSKLSIEALTDTLLITLTSKQYNYLKERIAGWQDISMHMTQHFSNSLLNQRSFLMNHDATYRYQYFLKHYPHILQRVPLSTVATFLGIKQQSLSRIRSQI